jgi:hypothetical protein
VVGLAVLLGRHMPERQARALAAATVPSLLAAVLAAAAFWPAVSKLFNDAQRNSHITRLHGAIAGGIAAHARTDFLLWAQSQIPGRASFYFLGPPHWALWVTYQLTPRLAVSSPGQAQWVVLYDEPLSALGSNANQRFEEIPFAPGFGVARRR